MDLCIVITLYCSIVLSLTGGKIVVYTGALYITQGSGVTVDVTVVTNVGDDVTENVVCVISARVQVVGLQAVVNLCGSRAENKSWLAFMQRGVISDATEVAPE